jgi:hypothetical protein
VIGNPFATTPARKTPALRAIALRLGMLSGRGPEDRFGSYVIVNYPISSGAKR